LIIKTKDYFFGSSGGKIVGKERQQCFATELPGSNKACFDTKILAGSPKEPMDKPSINKRQNNNCQHNQDSYICFSEREIIPILSQSTRSKELYN